MPAASGRVHPESRIPSKYVNQRSISFRGIVYIGNGTVKKLNGGDRGNSDISGIEKPSAPLG